MKIIGEKEFWQTINASENVIIAINDYKYLMDEFPDQYLYMRNIQTIHLEDQWGSFKRQDAPSLFDFLLWKDNGKINEGLLFLDISHVVQLYLPMTDESILKAFPNYLAGVCCMMSSFDEKSLFEAWSLVQNGSLEWIILDTTNDNYNDRYILIEKEKEFFIEEDLRERLNIF